MKKIPVLISITVVLSIILSSCTFYTNKSNEPVADYVSLTYSENATENNDGNIYTQILSYDSLTKEIKEVFKFEYTSQYPLGYYDKANELVYYTKRVGNDNDYGDQIFSTDLSNNEEKQLTNNLFAVNYIIPTQDKVFFAARSKGNEVLRLGSINKKTEEISYWGDDDTIIEAMTVDKKSRKVFISTYSMKERNYNLLHQEGPAGQDNFKMPKHTVYQTDYDFKNTKELFSENLWIRTIMTKDDNIIALSDKKYNDAATPSMVISYNLTNNTTSEKLWSSFRMQVGDAGYSSDGNKIYAISVIDNQRGLYEYDLDTQKYEPLYKPDKGFVNNIQVVKN